MTRARDLASMLHSDGSLNISTSVNLGDNEKAYFGDANDLVIFHNASKSIIEDVGTGNLEVRGTNIEFLDGTGSEYYLTMANNGSVGLYWDGNLKLSTTSTGVDVTGTATVDQLSIDGVGAFGSFDSKSTISTESGFAGSDKDFRIKTTGGNVNHFVVQATTGNVGIGTSSPNQKLSVAGAIESTSTGGVAFYATGAGSYNQQNGSSGTAWAYGSVGGNAIPGTASTTFGMHHWNGSAWSNPLNIKSNSQIYAGAESQSIAAFGARRNGAAIEFGHYNNSGGYYGTLGSYGNAGIPYIGFSADCEDTANTFTTRGFKGNLIVGGSDGSLSFSQLTNASATGQTPTTRMLLNPDGNVGIGTTLIPADASLTVHNGIKLNAPTPSKQRIYSLYAGTNTYSLNSSGGAAVVFDRLPDSSDELAFETHYAGNSHLERMRISKEGRVTMPYQPAFHAHGTSTSWTVFSNGGWSTIVLPATTFNTGNHYNTASSAFTAPVTGVYHFYYKIYGRVQSGGGTSTYWQSRFQRNNNAISGHGSMLMGYLYNVGGADETATYSMNISLAANDQITLHAQSAGAYNGEYYPPNCEFGGYLIG